MCPAVRFSGDAKLPEGSVATALELAVDSAQTSSAGEEADQQVELGLLKPERKYLATICPVADGTQLENVNQSSGLSVAIGRTESDNGQAVLCQLCTPNEGEVVHSFSADFVDKSGTVKHRGFSISGKVMTSDKGAPFKHRRCIACTYLAPRST